MTVTALQTHPVEKPSPLKDKHGTVAILAALTLIREALTDNQLKMTLSYQKMLDLRLILQNKLGGELVHLLEVQKDALGHMHKAEIFTMVSLATFFISLAIPGAGVVGAAKLLAQGKTLMANFGAFTGILSSGYTIAGGAASLRISEIEESNKTDEGLIRANEDTAGVVADQTGVVAKTILQIQQAITAIINSTGAAMRAASK